ncbi:preprotein translocase subunit SecY [Candidatus Epulonipiscium fishelsonii]|uniref:Preprotein translocase subunit SecY n=1 Tax=Candidatus Epulonipiscium fishelsonii TaxID=77094 RepID=A0ACC8XFU7_9FIRM|nr:preprotein translocase subunit SecY [Epulopiscium sp. SCG-D08WGA-EpuloA1]OON95396.1 MAG: preprotein translocase subunit SecY [Epulopiscium sp. AS2M-Bin002]
MFKTLINAWRVPDLKKKIIFTFWMMAFIRIGAHIPAPGINRAAVESMMNADSNNLLGLMNVITGGAFSSMAIFAFGVGPYITSSIIIQLLTIAISRLEELSKEGEDGRKKISKYTRYLTLFIAIMQGSGTTLMLYNSNVLSERTPLMFSLTILSFVAGSMLVMWIGEQITEKGVGNGTSLIIFINIVSSLPNEIIALLSYQNYIKAIILIILFVILIAFTVLMSLGERRINVQYAKRMSGRKVYGGQSQHIPIKVNLSGVLPVIFAMSLLQFPEIITNLFVKHPTDGWMTVIENLRWTTPVGAIIYLLLIFGFAFFYSTIAFNPVEIASNMKKSGGFIPGIRPGKPTSDYLSRIATHVTLIGAVFLAFLAMTPLLFTAIFDMQVAFTGTSLLIVVGVALETIKQLESQMLMRQYKGFL